ncbi:MAG: transglycosylase SLT domain-containing protein [Betaproteobacteria bacterium]
MARRGNPDRATPRELALLVAVATVSVLAWSPSLMAAEAAALATIPTNAPLVARLTPPADTGDVDVDVAALRSLATRYENGEGLPKDPLRAFELYCKAAKEGDAEAQYDLGWMYFNGRGVDRNDALAAFFFRLAAEQGHVQAATLVARAGTPVAEPPACMLDPPPLPPLPDPPDDVLDDGSSFVATTAEQERVAALVRKLAPEFQVSPLLALAVIRAESNFNPLARSPKNAQGLMQLIPETSQRFKVTKPYDVTQNLRGGLAYLRWLLAYFEGNVSLVAAAYNAGEKTVDRYRGVPPYAETRDYVKRVIKGFGKATHPYDATVTEPSPESDRLMSGRSR